MVLIACFKGTTTKCFSIIYRQNYVRWLKSQALYFAIINIDVLYLFVRKSFCSIASFCIVNYKPAYVAREVAACQLPKRTVTKMTLNYFRLTGIFFTTSAILKVF